MNLTDCDFPLSINTSRMNPLTELFQPALKASLKYDVAVGYFSTAWVRDAAEGIAEFATNGGRARWLISPEIQPSDFTTFETLTDDEQFQALSKIAHSSLESLLQALRDETRITFCWLIHTGIIELKLAVPKVQTDGMFHAKMGVFEDEVGSKIGFSGSYNLTSRAGSNWEKIDIYKSWEGDESRIRIITKEFEDLWNDNDNRFRSYAIADLEKLPQISETVKTTKCPFKLPTRKESRWPIYGPPSFALDEKEQLRDYQEEAMKLWLKNDGLGLLAMATGSGKTVTALSCVSKLANNFTQRKHPLLTIVAVPYQHLAEQWAEDARKFNFSPILCYGGVAKWQSAVKRKILELNNRIEKHILLITVNDTFVSQNFHDEITHFNGPICFVADEAHNLGSVTYRSSLDPRYRYRLGLSATPERDRDEAGTAAVMDYFGGVIFEFSLELAIKRQFLTPYSYQLIPCYFNEIEMDEYHTLSKQISRYAAGALSGDNPSIEKKYESLLIKRARLVSSLESKVDNLRLHLSKRTESKHNLIYCGDASDEGERQITKITRLVGSELSMKVNKFTSDETINERHAILENFSSGELQVIAAIRCLDEGVDVPATQTAYILSSSTNPRQFVQRRGRVLRLSQGKRRAQIIDFLALPEVKHETQHRKVQLSASEKGLLQKELTRVSEFANLAVNAGEIIPYVEKLKQRYGILYENT